MIEARTPGKLIIAGEYAVLEGAPAIAMAVDVHARAYLSPGSDSWVFNDIFSGCRHVFTIGSNCRPVWREKPPDFGAPLIAAAFAALAPLMSVHAAPAVLELDTSGFYAGDNEARTKLGLGSSAAILTALVGALAAHYDLAISDSALGVICRDAHRDVQGGQGSGIDVFTSLLGGIVAFRSAPGGTGEPVAERLDWPAGLCVLPVCSDTPASTPRLMALYRAWREHEPAAFARLLDALSAAGGAVLNAWRNADAAAVVAAVARYAEVLYQLDSEAAIGIDTDFHRGVRAIAQRHGMVYKTSGAGGGDFGFALSDDESALNDLRTELLHKNVSVPSLRLAANGLEIFRTPCGRDR